MNKDPLIGRVLHDTHEVLRLIGKGGMGSVYEARHVHLKKSFAVKVLDPRFAENETIFARFKREALISSSLGHPAIVQVSDFYIHDDGRPCMVMEYLEGRDLGMVLKDRKTRPPEEMVHIVDQVAGALQAVHDKKIVHRDMKPGNIFLAEQEDGSVQAKVLDFGISKFKSPDEGGETLTTSNTILGTPHFMSPEQALGEVGDVDWRTDIFALATICYYAMSGKLPFNAPSLHGVLVKIQTMDPAPITGLAPGVSDRVHRVLQQAMAKDKADRYDRVEQFAADIRQALTVNAEPSPDEKPDGALGMATMIDMQPVFSEETEEAPVQSPPSEEAPAVVDPEDPAQQQESDPNMTNVLPLDELMGELDGAAEEPPAAGPDAAETELPEPVEAMPDGEEPEADSGEPEPDSREPEPDGPSAVSPHTTLSGAAGEQSTQKVTPTPGGKPMAAKTLAAAAVLMLALGGVYMATRNPVDPGLASQGSETSVAAAPQPEPAPTPPKTAPLAKPIPAQVRVAKPEPTPASATVEKEVAVKLQIIPRSARILIDGRPRSENPLRLPQSNKQHRLRIEARGYKPHEQDLHANMNQTIKVDLSKTTPAVATKPRRARTPSTAIKPTDRADPVDNKPRPPAKKKSLEDDGFSTLTAPAPKPKPKPKKKTSEEAFDSL